MKKIVFFLFTIISCCMNAQENIKLSERDSFEKLWKAVTDFEMKDLPKSAEAVTDIILRKAKKTSDFQNHAKAVMHKARLRMDVSTDSILVDVMAMEDLINSDVVQSGNDKAAKNAIMHALMASVYQSVSYTRHFYANQEIKARCTELINQHVDQALKEKELIANVDAKPYEALFTSGVDSKLFNNDVLSLIICFVEKQNLMNYRTNSKENLIQHLQQTADVYERLDMKDAYILTQLKIWQFQTSIESRANRMTNDEYLKNLKNLYMQSVRLEAGADAFIEYYNHAYFDSKQKRLELLQWAEKQWSQTVHAKSISNLRKQLFDKKVNVYVNDDIIAERPFKIYVSHVNVNNLDVTVRNSQNKLVFSHTIIDNEPAPQEQKQDTLTLSLMPGSYVVDVKAGDNIKHTDFKVSSLKIVTTRLPKTECTVTVLNALTGLPQKQCKVIAGSSKWINGSYVTTDSVIAYTDDLGQAVVSTAHSWVYAVLNDNDVSTRASIMSASNFDEDEQEEEYLYQVFTDRAVYKPGQTVYVTAYAYTKNGDNYQALPYHNIKLKASDANWQEFRNNTLKTDNFGMVTDSIVIPKNLINGRFSVQVGNGTAYFTVEEYKRPTFDIEFNDIEGVLSFGDTITVTGWAKTYSGVPVQGAKVNIIVENRNADFWTPWRYNANWNQLNTFETTTDDDGKFSVKVFLDGDKASDLSLNEWRRFFTGVMHYRVSAKVTDLAGESHEQQLVFSASDYEFNLRIQAPDNIHQDNPKPFTVVALNPQGNKVEAKGTWILQRFENYPDNSGKYVDTGVEGKFVANTPFEISQLPQLQMGEYRIKVLAQDNKQHEFEEYKSFVLFSDKIQPITLKDDWIYSPQSYINDSTGVNLYFAVADDTPFVYAYVISKNNVEWKRIDTLDNNLQFLHLDFKNVYKDGVAVLIFYVKNNQLKELKKSFTYQEPDKSLKMNWTTFRDKLTPGQEETWTLTITDKDGKPVNAQMLATMYDASLDAIKKHSWDFNLYFYRNCPTIFTRESRAWDPPRAMGLNFQTTHSEFYNRTFNILLPFDQIDDMFMLTGRLSNGSVRMSKNVLMATAAVEVEDEAVMLDAAPMAARELDNDVMEEKAGDDRLDENIPDDNKVKIRSDFAETAFFYPNLISDQQGNVKISFRLPESLTKWNFIGFAHTQEFDYAIVNASAVAKKDFMVQPNMPRFVRNGDNATISVKIINQAETDVMGTAKMRLINPENDVVLIEKDVNFVANAGKTQPVVFNFQANDSIDMLICEITAQGNGFSDGERNWLPVLPDKKLITETLPFYIQNGESKDINIASLFNFNSPTAINRKMFFQYTDNPSWNVVLAMHAVMNPTDDDAISWSAALYANSALKHLATRVPQLEQLIQQWKDEEDDEATLQSELEKNQQLKDIILQEAPWMMEAHSETVNKKQIVEIFDRQLLDSRINKAIEKLSELQHNTGAWCWFKGMIPNYYTTFAVCDNLTRLYEYMKHVGEKMQPHVFDMMDKGLRFIDQVELKEFNDYMKKHKKAIPSNTTLHYLYMLAISDHKTTGDTKNMVNNYLKRLKGKAKNMTTYGKANIATTLMAFGKNKDALPYIKSINEYLVEKPGMGRFFDGENTYYSWCDYRIPSHVAAMKALYMAKDFYQAAGQYLYDMQIWLLRQKQTQQWNSIVNTINAVDILLTVSPDSAFYMEQMPDVTLSGHTVDFDRQSAGLGFVKTEIPEEIFSETVNSQNPVVNVRKNSPGFSWGSIYAQSFEKLDNMLQNGNELTVERKFYLEQNGEWIPVDDDYTYSVGDKLRIRHIVTADRDMDFVQIRSQHAACLEPVKIRSGYQSLGGRGGYLALHDASADLFFSTFQKGTATIDLDMYVTSTGNYSNGIVTVQCAYAPDFCGHSKGNRIIVE